jgi:hypothetical protein
MRYLAVLILSSLLSACFAYRPFVVKQESSAAPTGEVSIAVSAEPPQAIADGQQAVTLSLTARVGDAPIAGAALAVLVGGSGNTVSSETAETNADGVATVQVRSTKAETKSVLVTYDSQTYTGGDISFIAGPAATATLSCPRDVLRADGNIFTVNGTTPATCTVAANDAQGNGVAGVVFALTLSGTGNTLPTSVQTNAAGTADILISSTIVERKTLTATAAGISVSTPLRFVGQWYDANGPFSFDVSFHAAQPDYVWVSGIRSMSLLNLTTNALEDFSEGIPLDANGGQALVIPDGADTRLIFSMANGPTLSRLAVGDARFSEVVTPTFYIPQAADDATHVWLTSSAQTNGSAPVVVFASRQSNGTWLNTARIAGLPDGYSVRQIVRASTGTVFALVSSTITSLSLVYRWNGTTWVDFSAAECSSGFSNLTVNNAATPPALYLACVKSGALRVFKSPSDTFSWTEDANFSDPVFLSTLQNVPPNSSFITVNVPSDSSGLMILALRNDTEVSLYSRQLPSGTFTWLGGVGLGGVGSILRSSGPRTTLVSNNGIEVVSTQAPTRLFEGFRGDLYSIATGADGTVFLRGSARLYRMPEEGRAIVEYAPGADIYSMAVDGNDVYLGTGAGVFRRRSGVWSACSAGLAPEGMPSQNAPLTEMIVADVPGEGRRVIAASSAGEASSQDGVYFLDPAPSTCTWVKKTNGQAPTSFLASLSFGGGKVYVVGQASLIFTYESGTWTSLDPSEGTTIQAFSVAPDGRLFVQFGNGDFFRYDALNTTPVPILLSGDVDPPLFLGLSFDSGDLYASVSGANRVIAYRLRANQLAAAAPRLQAITLDGSSSVNATYGRAFTRIGDRLYAIINVFGSLIASVSDGN